MNLEKVTVARADGQGQVGHFRSPSADTYLQLNVNVELNRTYTLHGYIKSAGNGTLSCLGKSVGTTASWNHFSMQIVPDSKIFSLVFSPGEYWFYNFKLEKGTIMTQWTPNGEDLVVVKQNIVSMGSSINQLNDKITQKVWMTEVNAATGEVNAHLTNVEQTANKINWLVKSGTDSSNMVLTDNAYSLIAKNIDLKGNATFSSFLDTDKTYINGGKIATGSITANQIAADAITAEKISTDAIKSRNYKYDVSGSYLDLNTGTFDSKNFRITSDGNVYLIGEIAASGGKIGGYTISEHKLVGKSVGMSSLTGHAWAFWAGNDDDSKAPFRVGHDGHLYATNADITGTVNAINGTFNGIIKSDNPNTLYSAEITDGSINFYSSKNDKKILNGRICAWKWMSENYSMLGIGISQDSTGFSLSIKSDNSYKLKYVLNNGENPNGITNTHIWFGDEYHTGLVQVGAWGIDFIADNVHTKLTPQGSGGLVVNNRFGVKSSFANYDFGVAGSGYASSGFTSGSDKRLKHNIEKMTDDFEKIVDFLSPSSYVYNSSTNEKKHLGFIAQEVQQAFSNCNINPNDYEIVNDRGDGMLSLTYDDLISILWKVCQSLRKDNKEIKRQLSSLQNQISSQGLAIQQQSLDNQLVI